MWACLSDARDSLSVCDDWGNDGHGRVQISPTCNENIDVLARLYIFGLPHISWHWWCRTHGWPICCNSNMLNIPVSPTAQLQKSWSVLHNAKQTGELGEFSWHGTGWKNTVQGSLLVWEFPIKVLLVMVIRGSLAELPINDSLSGEVYAHHPNSQLLSWY